MKSDHHLFTNVENTLTELEALLSRGDEFLQRSNPKVSGWSIVYHVDHLNKAAGAIIDQLLNGKAPPSRGIKTLGRIVLFLGWFPRGVGKAPPSAIPISKSAKEAKADCLRIRAELQKLQEKGLETSFGFEHHVFGGMSPRQWMKFLPIHHRHHMKIISELI